MILSRRLRLVVRLSSKYVYAQIVKAVASGDHVLVSVTSKELKRFGWGPSYGNVSAAYLSGLLLGQKASKMGIKNVILDIGLRNPSRGSRIFAVLKGVVDSEIKVPHDERILPSEERIRGEHIASYAKKLLQEDQQHYEVTFSQYLSNGLRPEQLPDNFNQIRDNVLQIAEGGK
jgi:large subunit ribosomal protein L18